MPKRKRSDFEPSSRGVGIVDEALEAPNGASESTRSIAIQQQSIEQKIHHHRILLKRALKTAKGFEQQKLGKRIKSARKGRLPPAKAKDGKDEIERLEKELEGLKNVDLQSLATTYLNRTLLKNRQLSSSQYFPQSVAKEVEEHAKLPVPTGPVANVCARLLNANPVKEAIKEITSNLGRLLGLEEGEEATNKASKEREKSDTTDPKQVLHGKGRELAKDTDSVSRSNSESDENDISSEESVVHPSTLKNLAAKYLKNGGAVSSDDEDEGEEEGFGDRIAWSSEDENEDEEDEDSDEEEEERQRGRSMSITPIPEDELRAMEAAENEDLDISLSEDDEDDMSDSESAPKNSEPKKSKQKPALPAAPTGPIKASSFLPTLMTGYISGSESDDSSTSSTGAGKKKKTGPPAKKVRKNRMGQQARRALAEKKYGVGANHVKKAKEEKEAKMRAKEDRKKAWEEKQNKAVHVSWQLKKDEKDKKDKIVKDMMAGKAAGVGKKIVFD